MEVLSEDGRISLHMSLEVLRALSLEVQSATGYPTGYRAVTSMARCFPTLPPTALVWIASQEAQAMGHGRRSDGRLSMSMLRRSCF